MPYERTEKTVATLVDLTPAEREAWELVNAYRENRRGLAYETAIHAVGVSSEDYWSARRKLGIPSGQANRDAIRPGEKVLKPRRRLKWNPEGLNWI